MDLELNAAITRPHGRLAGAPLCGRSKTSGNVSVSASVLIKAVTTL